MRFLLLFKMSRNRVVRDCASARLQNSFIFSCLVWLFSNYSHFFRSPTFCAQNVAICWRTVKKRNSTLYTVKKFVVFLEANLKQSDKWLWVRGDAKKQNWHLLQWWWYSKSIFDEILSDPSGKRLLGILFGLFISL